MGAELQCPAADLEPYGWDRLLEGRSTSALAPAAASPFAVVETADIDEEGPFPLPLGADRPLGSLIHESAVSGRIAGVADQEDFESGALGPQWETSSSTPDGRIQETGAFGTASGSFALLMDSTGSGALNANEAVWTVDLSGLTRAELVFSHADFNDEENPLPPDFVGSASGDGVAISDDGVTWHTVLNATAVSPGVWEQVNVDLVAEAAVAGMALGPDFQIKFQQFDDFPLTTDGRGYDDIAVEVPGGDVDRFEIPIDPGQTITVVIEPEGSLQPTLSLSEAGTTFASTEAAAPGAAVVLQTVPTAGRLAGNGPQPRLYEVQVGSLGDTLGNYVLRIILNAAVETEIYGGTRNDSLQDSQSLEPSFLPLLSAIDGDEIGADLGSHPERGAVLAEADAPTGVPVGSEDFESGALGPQWETSSSTPDGRIQETGAFGTASGSFALLMDSTGSGALNANEAVWTVDLSGLTRAELVFSHADFNDEENPLPPDFVGSASGDGVAISDDGVTWHTVLNATAVSPGVWEQVNVDLVAEAAVAGMALGPDFQIKFQQFDDFPLTTDGRGYDDIAVRIPVDPGDLYAFELAAGESATLAVVARGPGRVGVELLDSSGTVIAGGGPPDTFTNGSFEAGTFTGWSAATTGTPFIPWTVSGAGFGAGFGMAPTSPQDGVFVAWNGFDGIGPMSFTLIQDIAIPSDPALATLSWRERIQWNFGLGGIATLPRTYHVELIDPGTDALLAALFDFSTGTQATNPSGDTGWQTHTADLAAFAGTTVRLRFREEIPQVSTGPAQLEIDDVRLGPPSPELPSNVDDLIDGFVAERSDTYFARIRGEGGTPYTLLVLRNAQLDLEPNDDLHGARSIDTPRVAGRRWILGHASGQTLYGASRNGELFTIDTATGSGALVGVIPGPSTEIEVDAADRAFTQFSDGAFAGQMFDIDTAAGIGAPIFNGASFTGLEWIGNMLFGAAITGPGFPSSLRILDPSSGGSVIVGPTGVGPIAGLAYDPSSDVLYGVGGGSGPATLFTLDRGTGIATPVGTTGFQAGSLEFGPDSVLYGGGTGPNGGNLYAIDPATGASTLVGATGFSTVTGLALRGGAGDFYSVELGDNQPLHLRTYTPAAKAGEFVNAFDPMIRLYDASGNLIGSDDDSASDGRNSRLYFKTDAGGAGRYFIEITRSPNNGEPRGGEYLLSIK